MQERELSRPLDYYELSSAQLRLWFLHQLNPESSAYHIIKAMRFRGPLSATILERTFREIWQRHETLRTAIRTQRGKPVAELRSVPPRVMPRVDLSGLPSERRDLETHVLAWREAVRPFSLESGQLLRVRLIRVAEDEHVLCLVMHHIAADGWSIGIVIRELSLLYDAFRNEKPYPLPDLPLRYRDYARLQHEDVTGDRLEELLDYWRQRLQGAPHMLHLPRRVGDFENMRAGALFQHRIPSHLTSAIEQFCRSRGVTRFMLLLAGYYVLLFRFTGQSDLVVGTPTANRERVGSGSLVGFFINMLALRADLSGNPTFADLVKLVRDITQGALEHQDLPFDRLVEELRPRRDVVHAPIFQTLFAVQRAPSGIPEIDGMEMSSVNLHPGDPPYELTFSINERPQGLVIGADYNARKLSPNLVRAMVAAYECLLDHAMADPDTRVTELNLLDADERQRQIRSFRGPEIPIPETSIAELFSEQSSRVPDRVAILAGEEHITYRALARNADGLAAELRRREVGRESVVGIAMQRSIHLIAALIAIGRCGAAYMPIDPQDPGERRSHFFEDVLPVLVLTDNLTEGNCPAHWPTLRSDIVFPSQNGTRGNAGTESGYRENLTAYVLPTSGSTGRPKAVMCERRALVNHLLAMQHRIGCHDQDVWIASTKLTFDISALEIFLPLITGARLVLALDAERATGFPAKLAERESATIGQATPSGWRTLINSGWEGRVRIGLCGGEAMSPHLAEALLARCDEVWSVYGPTETTIWVTACLVRPGLTMPAIAGPLANVEMYVLDASGKPVPFGVQGELYIGGAALAVGYCGRPDLTAQYFCPDSFSGRPGSRLYKTGDRVRIRDDGALDFLGRLDDQVKVRGHRVELGEVENALKRQPGVKDAVVTAPRDSVTGSRRLLAYLCRQGTSELRATELRRALQSLLPEFMIPAAFIILDAFPLTPNGKLDRSSLPQAVPERPPLAKAYVGPKTSVEVTLVKIWADLMEVQSVGVFDNFFELGGDSMRAVECVALARASDIPIELTDLFHYQTVKSLATVAETRTPLQPAGVQPEIEPFSLIQPADRALMEPDVQDAYPLSRLQAGMVIESEGSAEQPVYHNVLSIELRAHFGADRLKASLQELVAEHPILRTHFELYRYSEPLQIVQREAQARLTSEDLRELDEASRKKSVENRVHLEYHQGIPLNEAPLLRCHLQLLDEQRVQITISSHHGILDGWSRTLFMTQLVRRAVGLDGPARVSPTDNRFRDFVMLERQAGTSEAAKTFWNKKLKVLPDTSLSRNHRIIHRRSDTWDRLKQAVVIPGEWVVQLFDTAGHNGVPIKIVLLAVHLEALARLTGQTEVSTGVVTNARPDKPGSDSALGLFLNTLPLCSRVDLEWPEFLHALLQAEGELLVHRYFPLSHFKGDIGNQLFDTVFNFVHYRAYRELQVSDRCELLSAVTIEDPGLSFAANFGIDPVTGEIRLVLESSRGHLDPRGLTDISSVYSEVLKEIASGHRSKRGELHQLERLPATAPANGPLVHVSIQARAQVAPDRIAAIDGDSQISYGRLDALSDYLATTLVQRGVGPESIVGVSSERCTHAIAALLGVLKAGAAYLPLDPQDPTERLRFRLAETGIRYVLSRQSEASIFAALGVEVILTDVREEEKATGRLAQNVSVDPSNPAYVIYTSGSTGLPKGVVIEHRSLAGYVAAAIEKLGLNAEDLVLQFASLTFDAAAEEIFPALCVGAALVLRPKSLDSIPAFLDMCAAESVTVIDLPTAFWDVLVTEMDRSGSRPPSTVRLVIIGGEAARGETLRTWRNRVSSKVLLLNSYGPTETTIAIVWCQLSGSAEELPSGLVPIGHPLSGVRAYVLDERLLPVTDGVVGELFIAGYVLARGYLHRPEFTAENFMPDPFAGEAGARMYRTGDRCFRESDGRLIYVGRQDRQVKVRGFRVELDEIEAVLNSDPGISAAAVVTYEPHPAKHRIVAFVVLRRSGQPTPSRAALVESIRRRLPAYFVPSEIRMVPTLPRTPSGKIDRSALAGTADALRRESKRAERMTPTEELVADIWEELIGIEGVGRDDNFFELGGHSLIALQAVSHLRETFDVELPLRVLFEASTVSSLAHAIEGGQGREPSRLLPLERVDRSQPVMLSYAQSDIWLQNQAKGASSLFNMPVAAWLDGPLNCQALRKSLVEIVCRHEILHSVFREDGAAVVSRAMPTDTFDLDIADLSELPDEERAHRVEELVHAETGLAFDLHTEIPFRALLVRLSAREHLLIMTLHHIAGDGWSFHVLLDELCWSYPQLSFGRPSGIVTPPIQYRDYASWQKRCLEQGAFENDMTFWGERLKDLRPARSLSREESDQKLSFVYAEEYLTLRPAQAQRLREFARAHHCTPFMVLIAVFGLLCHWKNGETDFRVGTLIANRNMRETESVIGLFANTLILRTELLPLEPFRLFLTRVRRSTLEAYEHREAPFEAVIDRIWPNETSRNGMFRVMFLMDDMPSRPAQLGDLQVGPFKGRHSRSTLVLLSTHELILNVSEREDALTIHTRFDLARFDHAAIQSLLRAYESLMTQCLENADTAVHEHVARLASLG